MLRLSILCAFASLCAPLFVFAADTEPPKKMSGEVKYLPAENETGIPDCFKLAAHSFAYEGIRFPLESKTIEIWEVTFPSPVKTSSAINNTVHCEYYRPKGLAEGKKAPGVVVLHILGGDFQLSRLFCNNLAQRGVAALFLKMPYYGPRRDPASPRRMISPKPDETVEGMTQAILDIRRGAAWLGAREEVNPDELGIFGISLGGITGALAATAEPRLKNVCLLLAGGDLGKVVLESKEIEKYKKEFGKLPDKDEFLSKLKVIDPVTYGTNVKGRHILMLNAKDDEIIPKACTESLWKSFGEPPIHWYTGGHYSVAWHMVDALGKTGEFFAEAGKK
jgi:dienelactone hydrolase